MGDDNPAVARRACESYRKNPKEVIGDVLVFQGPQKSSYGGYANYVDKNVSIKQLAPNKWEIIDRHYQDEEGGGKAGYKNVKYEVTFEGDFLTIKEEKYTTRFARCAG